jgi:glycosyltransferase involved in cell wall biosynthesis
MNATTPSSLGMRSPLDLTVAIPARNDAVILGACLDALGTDFAKNIVIIDSGEEDGTASVAALHRATLLRFCWDGRFPKKRNWFLRNHPPDTSWVLFLDADEIVTPGFKEELRRVLPSSREAGYWLRYSIHFMGRRLRHGYPLRKLALFRVGTGEYERIEEDFWSTLDMEVHEHPVLNGNTGEIRSLIDHRDDRGVSDYVRKHDEYSSWEAARILTSESETPDRARWTWKQRLKRRLVLSPLAGPVYFVGAYVLMGGFLDGARGLEFAILKASYFTQVACKVRELKTLGPERRMSCRGTAPKPPQHQ